MPFVVVVSVDLVAQTPQVFSFTFAEFSCWPDERCVSFGRGVCSVSISIVALGMFMFYQVCERVLSLHTT